MCSIKEGFSDFQTRCQPIATRVLDQREAAVSLGFGGYFSSLIGFGNIKILAIFSIILFSIINIFGIKKSMKLNI